jgi:hypothetical protein
LRALCLDESQPDIERRPLLAEIDEGRVRQGAAPAGAVAEGASDQSPSTQTRRDTAGSGSESRAWLDGATSSPSGRVPCTVLVDGLSARLGGEIVV